MHDTATSVITAWSNFYVITGSSAGSLTGLMFVVISLVVGGNRSRAAGEGIPTFSTPTVVHFGAALLVSAILSAPWHLLVQAAVILGLTGLYGVALVLWMTVRMNRQTAYRPGVDDWVWYSVLPLVAYLAVAAGAILLPLVPGEALFALAGGTLLLIFIGIHNAWDIVTYIAIVLPEDQSPESNESRAE